MVKRNPVLTVIFKNVGFWTKIVEDDQEQITITDPYRYLEEGETVTLVEDTFYYRTPWADKPYYKVKHKVYGEGYILAEALRR